MAARKPSRPICQPEPPSSTIQPQPPKRRRAVPCRRKPTVPVPAMRTPPSLLPRPEERAMRASVLTLTRQPGKSVCSSAFSRAPFSPEPPAVWPPSGASSACNPCRRLCSSGPKPSALGLWPGTRQAERTAPSSSQSTSRQEVPPLSIPASLMPAPPAAQRPWPHHSAPGPAPAPPVPPCSRGAAAGCGWLWRGASHWWGAH